MAEAILPMILVLTTMKAFFVIDALLWPDGGIIAHAAQSIRSQKSQVMARSSVGSPRQQAKGRAGAGASKPRSLHLRLLSMHMTSVLSQSSATAKYLLPVSDMSCVVTHRIMVALILLYDASLVLFLLAKVHVTNANRTLTCWEKAIIWWSRFYGWIYLPFGALGLGITFPGGASHEREFCFNGYKSGDGAVQNGSNARGFGTNNAVMIVQFLLLLLIFVKPMLVRVEGTQSGGAVYRRLVLRNIFSTIGVVTSYSITTVVVVLALLRESTDSSKSGQIRDVALAVNGFGTLCLTEISLPLGVSSCMKACSAGVVNGGSTKTEARGTTAKLGTPATRITNTSTKRVIPLEGFPPSTP